MADLKLRIVTIEKVVVDEPVSMLNINTDEGAIGILPGHIPLLTVVRPGTLRYKTKTREHRLVASSGSLEVKDNVATVVVGEALPVESIDVHKAAAERDRLTGILKQGELSAIELRETREQLATALAKLRARK